MTYILWIIQVLLALLFLFAGGTKLVLPIETLASMGSPNQILLPGLADPVYRCLRSAGRGGLDSTRVAED